jgi:hypothetical protein
MEEDSGLLEWDAEFVLAIVSKAIQSLKILENVCSDTVSQCHIPEDRNSQ